MVDYQASPVLSGRILDVCLLSVVLLLPYFARGHAPLLVGSMGLTYSCLVLPMIISANYKYPLSGVRPFLLHATTTCQLFLGPVLRFLKRVYAPLDRTEDVFLKMTNISTMANQILFFTLCYVPDTVVHVMLSSRNCSSCCAILQKLLFTLCYPPETVLHILFFMLCYPPETLLHVMLCSRNFSCWALFQILFFMLCDKVLVPDQRVTCLYSLMFYNVIAYCVSYIKELIEKENWSPYVPMTEHSNMKHLAMSATKIVLEWTKAVTFIMTVVFMLLVFGLEQGLQHYSPTAAYTVLTWLYYMATERVFVDSFPNLLSVLQLDALESLETLWSPVILRVFTLTMSALFVAPLAAMGQCYRLIGVATYVNLHLGFKELRLNALKVLNAERAVVGKYRYATLEELGEFDDVCAVCLSPMRLARITPCHHLFHGDCLRQCLKTSDNCPMCKRELKFD
uniref:RING-type domain-containing protein n=1 Tax=Timema bartmani TaxID=61472 RepID=A0A7R9F9B8_9NEOP|nr:unnamed protein product [Timema bartmani]